MDQFPTSGYTVRPEGVSDHCVMVIFSELRNQRAKRTFRYFNMWSQNDEFVSIVSGNWCRRIQGTKQFAIVMKLKNLMKGLSKLNQERFHEIDK